MSEERPWRTIKSEIALNTPWYRVDKDTVQLPNGTIINDYYHSKLKSVAIIMPITKTGRVVFVQQYRYPIKETLTELPAGTYNPSTEKPLDVVVRELREETGYVCGTIVHLSTLYEYPTKDSHQIDLFLGLDAEHTATAHPERTEDIKVVEYPLSDLGTMMERGDIRVSGSVAAISLASIYLKKHQHSHQFDL